MFQTTDNVELYFPPEPLRVELDLSR